jgi:hypothetical protein
MGHNVVLIGGLWLVATVEYGSYAAGAAIQSQPGSHR